VLRSRKSSERAMPEDTTDPSEDSEETPGELLPLLLRESSEEESSRSEFSREVEDTSED